MPEDPCRGAVSVTLQSSLARDIKTPMKRRISALFMLLILLGSCPLARGAERELLDQVIAVVNDEPITQSELDVLLRPLYEQYRQEFQGEELVMRINDARRKLLNQLIEDRLVIQEATKKEIHVDAAEVDEDMDKFKARFPNETAMEDLLKEQGISLNDIRKKLEKQAMMRQLHNQEIRAKVVVSPMEIEEYYKQNATKFDQEPRIKVRSITVKKSYEARDKGIVDEEAKMKIAEIRKRLLSGEDFGVLAKQFSEDVQAANSGLSDWIPHGSMIPVIDEVIFSLKLGEISQVIETPMGYHLFRVEEKEPSIKHTLEDVRDKIFGELYQQKSEARFNEWMQELKRNAYISIR